MRGVSLYTFLRVFVYYLRYLHVLRPLTCLLRASISLRPCCIALERYFIKLFSNEGFNKFSRRNSPARSFTCPFEDENYISVNAGKRIVS